jgi:NitT/TauT family transport system substrate-binding protein
MRTARGLIASLAALLLGATPGNAAPGNTAAGNPTEHIKMCAVRSLGSSPSIIAKDKGFFAKQGLDTEIVLFESAQPIAVAVTSGDCDFAPPG